MDDSKIIRLDPHRRPIEIKRGYDGCQHKLIEIDSKHRTVACRKCKQLLDPIQALIDLCNDQHPHWVHVRMLQAKIDQKQAQLDEVSRLLRNAKAKLRRLGPVEDE